jgi:hypothetical protein
VPNRIRLTHAVAATSVAVSVGAIAALLPTGLIGGGALEPNLASWMAWPIVFVGAFSFLFRCVFGQQFLVLPWLGLAVIAITCGSLVLAGPGSRAAAFAAYLGFGICIIVRSAYSLVPATTCDRY